MDYRERFCVYDKRNPNHLEGERSVDCCCDNCFYGRHEMAEEIERLKKEIEVLRGTWKSQQTIYGRDAHGEE